MYRRTCCLFLLVIAANGATSAVAEEEFVTLFNGRDLTGWINPPGSHWAVEDGVIALHRDPDSKEHNQVYLWTEEEYGDFVLELEFKIPERANSGIFLRTADINDPVYTGLEIQVANSYGRTSLTRGGTAGAVYDCLAPTANPVRKPGEWNRCRITCQGHLLKVELNARQIIDMDLDQWTEPHRNPDGSKNKFGTAIKDFARVGRIGLQDHGLPVWYRNVRIQRLD